MLAFTQEKNIHIRLKPTKTQRPRILAGLADEQSGERR
jgi:hypothetical protein